MAPDASRGGDMKRFFSEFGFVMKNRKHFFFMVVVWTILSVVTLAYGISLKNTVNAAFAEEKSGMRAVNYEIEAEENLIISAEILNQEVQLNNLLCNNEKFTYSVYLDTTATIAKLNNLELAVNAESTADGEAAEGQKSYKVKVLFVDKTTAEQAGLTGAMFLFDAANDYDQSVPMLLGNGWTSEVTQEGLPAEELITEIDNYKMNSLSFMAPETTFSHSGTEIVLDNYILIPLSELTDENFPTTQDGRKRWYDIYRIKNQGSIHTDMSPNTLQKYLDDLMEESKLPYRLLVEGAEHDNRLLFRDDVNEITKLVVTIGYAALAVAFLLLVGYLIVNYSISSRYLFLSYLTGTGKVEFIFVSALQIIIYFVFTVIPAYILLFGLSRITSVNMTAVKYVVLPVVILAIVGMITNIVRIVLWDAGKKLRSV